MANEQLNQLLDDAIARHDETFAQFGGPAPVHLASGGIPFVPRAVMSGTARDELQAIKDQWDAYTPQAQAYNDALNKWKTETYDPYAAAVDKYNAAAEAYNKTDRTKAFDMAAPTAIQDFSMAAPKAPEITQEQYQAKADAANAALKGRQMGIDAFTDPDRFNLSIGSHFADGGEVQEESVYGPITAKRILQSLGDVGTDIGRGAVSNAESLLRGAVSQVPGTIGDLEALGRKAVNWSFGPGGVKVDEKTIAPTSEEIRAAVPRGTSVRPESAGMESLGEVMAPGFAKAAAPVAKTVGREAGRQILRGMEGEGPLRAVSPPVAFAVKPRGGTFASSGSLDAPPLSKFDEMLDSYATRAQQEVPTESKDLVKEFIDKKARKYFTTEYGTGSDALRNAIRTGDMPVMGRDVERFPPYLLHAAKDPSVPGHEMAKQHLEKAYDNATNMEGNVLGLINSSDADARRMFQEHMRQTREQQRQLMSAEGLPDTFQNPSLSSHTLSDLEAYPSSTGGIRRLLEAGEQGTLPSGVQGALQRQQPVYDIRQPYMEFLNPRTVAENIAALPPNKLKNMSFADAMIEGNKKLQVFRDYDTAISKAERGGNLPKEVTELYTKPFLKGDTGEWRQITEPRATDLEGKLMGHSVGGYREGETYGTTYTGLPYGGKKAFEEGLVKVYSLRNEKGQPTVTLEMAKSDGGKGDKWNITQIRGPFNSEPAKNQWDDIFKLIDKGGDHIGIIKQNSYSMDRTGQGVANGTVVDWGREYDNWKNGIPSENYAKGGSVERKTSDNRRYL